MKSLMKQRYSLVRYEIFTTTLDEARLDVLGSRDFLCGHREQIKVTGVLGQLYRNGGRIPGAGEHGRGRTRVVLGCELQADYRTNHSESGAATILWAL
jgi:hypothetical protein